MVESGRITEVEITKKDSLLLPPVSSNGNRLMNIGGAPVYNFVTWKLNGSRKEVHDCYEDCIGHYRLWNIVNGLDLDVSSILGGQGKILFTTASENTFHFNIEYTDPDTKQFHWVILEIDGREGWNYGFRNTHGSFQYKTSSDPYMAAAKVLKFPGDYKSLAPLGLKNLEVDLMVVRTACRIVSECDGESQNMEDQSSACGILVNCICESLKFAETFDWIRKSLLCSYPCKLDTYNSLLAGQMKKWMKIGEGIVHFSILKMADPDTPVALVFPRNCGITSIEEGMKVLSIIPFNSIPKAGNRTRSWASSPLDPGAGNDGGMPHYYSKLVTGRWPYPSLVSVGRSKKKSINIFEAARYAVRVRWLKPRQLRAQSWVKPTQPRVEKQSVTTMGWKLTAARFVREFKQGMSRQFPRNFH